MLGEQDVALEPRESARILTVDTSGSPSAARNDRFRKAWLFSATRDLSIVGLPLVATLLAYFLGAVWNVTPAISRSYATWGSQFVLGNSTHVILTFLLVATRRDVLRATNRQANTIVYGSLAAFAVTVAVLGLSERYLPLGKDFVFAVLLIFATHHALAQVKGFWALHNLRASKSGLPAPSSRERWLQQHWVAIGLLLIMTRWLFVASSPGQMFPYIQAISGMYASLPFEASYVLLGLWGVYIAGVVRELFRAKQYSVSKLLYLAVHVSTVALMLFSPGWGAILASSIHGCEYFVLCGRILEPMEIDSSSKLRRPLVWPAMIAASTPLVIIGILNAPFAARFISAPLLSVAGALRIVLNGVVIAHYFADAFLYRFRVPEIRRVTLARLGFA